ncbi:hypothetical protein MJO28_002719 [Puccinia striiformis f. sp. tritici]|uniref:Uncharacterized protein n=1 Tax=Puccinia striiformis f. sp. tritici TaxID=168172 RepID=A0ACC0ER42_9BASI|nr:hypothetical protein MJO28_002719 [Puccinia striiformis f. sp. tritici]
MHFSPCADIDFVVDSPETDDESLEVEPEGRKQPLKKKKGSAKKVSEKTTPLQKTSSTKAPPSKKKNPSDLAPTPGNEPSNLVPPSQKTTPSTKAPPTDSSDRKGSRSKNYDDKEDVKICISWLNISQDPLNSTNQAGDTFWKRVGEHYKSTREDDYKFRTWQSVKSRWHILQHAVNKFCGAVAQVELANKSGENLEDHMTSALRFYKATSEKGKKFTHMQCYNILHKAPKWLELCAELEKKKREEKKNDVKGRSVNNSVVDDVDNDSDDLDSAQDDRATDTSPIKSSQAGRPPGNKKAKDLAEKAREDKKFKENIISVHRDLALQAKTQNNILAVQREALTTLADHAVMSTDLVAVSEASRPFFEWSQKKVLDKVEKERAEFEKKKKAEEREEAKKIARGNKNGEPKKKSGRHTRTTKAVDLIESSEEENEEEDGEDEKIEESEGEHQEDEDDEDDD